MSHADLSDIDWARLAPYCSGVCGAAERADVERWVAADPVRLAHVARVREAWEAIGAPPAPRPDVAAMWRAVETETGITRVRIPGTLGETRARTKRPARRMWTWTGTAITVCVAAVTTIVVWMGATRTGHPATAGARTTYATANGQRATITLADGSAVTLNVASRIDVPKHFGDSDRVVYLSGEAFFHVQHATGAPFVVEANGVRTTVLGTEFAVRSYRATDVQVAVRSGRVAVGSVVLGAQDIARISRDTILVARHQRVDAALGFTTGRLVLTNVRLRDAIAELNRWYDADIRLDDRALGELPLDAVLTSGSVGDLAEVLRNVFDVRVVRDGHTLTLYQR